MLMSILSYLSSVLNIVLLSRARAYAGGGSGSALLCAAQDDGILVQIARPLNGHSHGASLLTHIIAAGTKVKFKLTGI